MDVKPFPSKKYKCILIDPPWPQGKVGRFARHSAPDDLPYSTMTLDDIKDISVGSVSESGSHLWLWTTNQFLSSGFDVMSHWGFKYLAPIHWVKPSGFGAWFVHRTQTLLFGYKDKCVFPLGRYKPNVIFTSCPKRHSEKPDETYRYIEAISPGPRLELFARRKIDGWDAWGNEV